MLILSTPSNINAIVADPNQPQASTKPNSYQEAMASPIQTVASLHEGGTVMPIKNKVLGLKYPNQASPKASWILTGKWVYVHKAN